MSLSDPNNEEGLSDPRTFSPSPYERLGIDPEWADQNREQALKMFGESDTERFNRQWRENAPGPVGDMYGNPIPKPPAPGASSTGIAQATPAASSSSNGWPPFPEKLRNAPAIVQRVNAMRASRLSQGSPGAQPAATQAAPASSPQPVASSYQSSSPSVTPSGGSGVMAPSPVPVQTASSQPAPAASSVESSQATDGSTPSPSVIDYGTQGMAGLKKNLDMATAAAQAMRTGEDPALQSLEQDRDTLQNNRPQAYDPATGKRLDKYKPRVGQEILRGVEGVGLGLATGGLRGAIAGGIKPEEMGVAGYGAPTAQYGRDVARSDQGIASKTEQIADRFKTLKDQNDAAKAQAAELRANAATGNDLTKSAAELQNAATNASKNETTLRKGGFKTDAAGNIVPLDYGELSPEQQAHQALDQARTDAASALAELNKSKNDPTSPSYQLQLKRLSVAKQNADTALSRLGLSTEQFNMHAYNIGPDGKPLPGAMIGADGTPVGTVNAANVRPTASQKDAAGRADVADQLRASILQQLKDPEVRKAFGPLVGRFSQAQVQFGTASPKVAKAYNDLVSYGAFQAGMHPVRGIGALQYFDKVNGGMGQKPEELEGKLSSGQSVMREVRGVGTPRVQTGPESSAPAQTAPRQSSPAPARYVIQMNHKNYQYRGAGPTEDPQSYVEVK